MPIRPTYPGVYVEELPPQGPRTIGGVATSVTAFVGYTASGPLDTPLKVFNFGEFERHFGGLHLDSEVSYGVHQFFANGGSEAWIVRVAAGASRATVRLANLDGDDVLEVAARSEGTWGNDLYLVVDYATNNPHASFNLAVVQLERSDGQAPARVVRSEVFRNLEMNHYSPLFVESVVNQGSELVVAKLAPNIGSGGTGTSRSGPLTDVPPGLATNRFVRVSVDGGPPKIVDVRHGHEADDPPGNLAALVSSFQAGIQAAGLDVVVSQVDDRLLLEAVSEGERSAVFVTRAPSNNATKLLKLGIEDGGIEVPGAAALRPAPSGTVGLLASAIPPDLTDKSTRVILHRGTVPEPHDLDWSLEAGDPAPVTWSAVAARLQLLLRGLGGGFKNTIVEATGNRIVVRASGSPLGATIEFDDQASDQLAAALGFSDAKMSPSTYQLGRNVDPPGEGALVSASRGSDGVPPTNASLIIGNENDKTGLHALDDVEDVNILAIPSMATVDDTNHHAIAAEALAWCKARRSFFLLDPPLSGLKSKEDVAKWWGNVEKSDHGATFVPSVKIPDPLNGFRLRLVPPSGTMAGLFSRTDGERGIWKAAAGTDARLVNVQALQTVFTDAENGFLNQMGVNVLRELKVYGRVAWGARTLAGSDAISSPWKYISVRRLALYIEESLRQGLQWAVFEPNDEPLWAQIRMNVGAFLQGLFRQGAFQGTSPREAYFVKCDSETTTQNDINLGVLNVIVGFAPLKPAEFVVIQIQQMAGQIQA